jgi:membrane-bound ClpP family serine protease
VLNSLTFTLLMTLTAIILLIVLGLVLVLLEILLLPGFIVGVIGALLMIGGIVSAWLNYGTDTGLLVLGCTALGTVISVVLVFRSKTWNRVTLQSSIDSRVNVLKDNSVNPGDKGITISRLAPMGQALINNDYFEVEALEGWLNENTSIIVVKVTGNKIIVKQDNAQ